MQFANVSGKRTVATPGLAGTCPCCDSGLISKCGTVKAWHWAHKGKRHCDPWWENETQWHRKWKACFPESWVEIVHRDMGGEKHVADVKTRSDLVIEFQHSHIDARERFARERFYGRLIWIVDGNRLIKDHGTFFNHIHYKVAAPEPLVPFAFNPLVPAITKRWIDSTSVVYLDFNGDDLWCVSTKRVSWKKFVCRVPKIRFIEAFLTGNETIGVHKEEI